VVEDVVVRRLDASAVEVSWTRSAPGRVTVQAMTAFEAPGPDAVEAGSDDDHVVLKVPTHPRHVFVVRADGGPSIVAAERLVAVAGTLNFRDLGGYRGRAGRTVRWGRIYRSDNFAAVTESGWASVAELGVRAVYDLRHEAERDRAPSRIPEHLGIAMTHLPIGGEAAEAPDLVELLRSDAARFGVEFMIDMNLALLREHAAVFGQLLTALADESHLPAIFHCTAGKDRTGMAAALVLEVLGVERQAVLDDYELTTHYRSQHRIEELRPRLEAAGVDVEAVRPFLSAPRPALAAALAELDAAYGHVDGYLTEAAGVDPAVPERLRGILLA
jgi:protein-tyrosine phosphatase